MAEEHARTGLFYPGSRPGAEAAPPAAEEAPPEKKGIQRRLWFRWLGWGTIVALLGQWTVGTALGFFWPKKIGAFGGVVSAGNVSDLQVGDVRLVRDGKFFVSRVPEGVIALYWKCPHLGCTVPWKDTDPSMDTIKDKGRFNCPCHGSLYDRYGQIVAGPAPRPMDYFPIELQAGKIMVSTGPDKVKTRSQAAHGPPDVTPV
jgi:cytochrome b6-f complex iron-sulfur subunit